MGRPSRVCSLAVIAAGLALATPAAAETLSPADLARKDEKGYVTGLPLFAYSTDIGVGGGARAYYYWNGTRTDPRFPRTPYLHRVFLQAFVTTRGLQFHWLDYDAPKILDSPYRIRSQAILLRNINSNYFGLGNSALAPLQFPGSTTTYGTYDSYIADQQRITGNTTYAKYDQFDLLRPIFVASIERLFLDDRVRVLGGIGLTWARIADYTGKQVDAIADDGRETQATMAQTRLRQDCDRGLLLGCTGGWDNYLRFGISYDTRDFEPDPNNGIFADLSVDASTRALGSDFTYVRVMGAFRGYWQPDPASDVVLAGRGLLQVQTAGVPFFSMNTIPFTDDPRSGLGGHRTMRGFKQDRFVGRAMALLNAEIRWTFARFNLKSQKFGLIIAPFLDTGRSFDSADDLGLHRWRLAYGGAFRISWNLATLITVDYGRSSEDSGFYVNFGHIF